MRRKYILILAAFTSIGLLSLVLWWAPHSPSPSKLGVTFLAYTNRGAVLFQLTNESPHILQLASNCYLIDEHGQAFGSGPYVGLSPSKLLAPHATQTIAIYRPLSGAPWRVQFYAEPAGVVRWVRQVKLAARRVGLPVRNPRVESLVGVSEMMEP